MVEPVRLLTQTCLKTEVLYKNRVIDDIEYKVEIRIQRSGEREFSVESHVLLITKKMIHYSFSRLLSKSVLPTPLTDVI